MFEISLSLFLIVYFIMMETMMISYNKTGRKVHFFSLYLHGREKKIFKKSQEKKTSEGKIWFLSGSKLKRSHQNFTWSYNHEIIMQVSSSSSQLIISFYFQGEIWYDNWHQLRNTNSTSFPSNMSKGIHFQKIKNFYPHEYLKIKSNSENWYIIFPGK